jgi:hypothetical protein
MDLYARLGVMCEAFDGKGQSSITGTYETKTHETVDEEDAYALVVGFL